MYLAPRARVRAPWPTAPGYMYLLAENKAGYVYPAGWGRGPQKCTCPAPRGYMSVPGFPAPRARAQRRVHACTRRTKNKVANALAILFFFGRARPKGTCTPRARVHVPRAPGYMYPARPRARYMYPVRPRVHVLLQRTSTAAVSGWPRARMHVCCTPRYMRAAAGNGKYK